MKSLFLESRHTGGEILHKYSKVENPLSADGSWRGIFFFVCLLEVFWHNLFQAAQGEAAGIKHQQMEYR